MAIENAASTEFGSRDAVLFFAYYFPPENTSGAQRPMRFAKYLQGHGFEAHVLTASLQPSEAPWPRTIRTPDPSTHGLKARVGSGLAAVLQRVLPYNDQLPWSAHAAVSAERLAAEIRPVALFSTSPPVACHAAALLTKWRCGLPWIADFRDPFYANPLRPRKLSRPYEFVLEHLIFRYADAVIANTDAAKDTLERRYPAYKDKIHLIWNGYDPEERIAALPAPPRDHQVLLHAGTIYGARHPGALLDSIDRLIVRGKLDPDRVRLRLVGWMETTTLRWTEQPSFVALQNNGCLDYMNQVIPPSEANRQIAEADFLLLLDLNDTGAAVQVPAKLFQYIRIGRPILAFTNPNSPSERILQKSGVPNVIIYPDMSREEIDRRVASLFDLPSGPHPPSAWFQQEFNAKEQTRKLASILHTITQTSRKAGRRQLSA